MSAYSNGLICDFRDLHGDDDGAVQMFTFLLIDGNSTYTFGYCKYTPNTKTCTCILS